MFNILQVQAAFAKLVGFKQPNDPSYPPVNSVLSSSDTGMFIQHPLCSIENLYNAGPEFAGFTNPTVLTVKFNEYLQGIYNESCTMLIAKLLEMKKIQDSAKSLLESQVLYTGFGFGGDKIIRKSRFVGYRINTSLKQNVMVILNQIGFQIDTAQTVKFYLYHSSQINPVAEIEVVISRANSFNWYDSLNKFLLSHMMGNNNSNGTFYFGYYEDDLIGQVIRMDKSLQSPPCASCSYADTDAYNAWSKFVGIQAISVEAEFLDLEERTIFDLTKIVDVSSNNWGINLNITAVCDLTSFFTRNKRAFTDALAKQIELNIFTKIAYSTRINSISDKTKGLAMADLDATSESSYLNAEYKPALKALSVDFSGFDSNCLPCQHNKGIHVSAI